MDNNKTVQRPEQWLAVIRIAVGLWFFKALWTKWVLLGGFIPLPMASGRWIETLPKIIGGYVNSNPLQWCRQFLENNVIPNAETFAHLTAVGEGLVGIGLTFGILTRTSSAGALFLLLSYEIAAFGLPFSRHGLRLIMIVAVVAFFFARAGYVWGFDGWWAKREKSGG